VRAELPHFPKNLSSRAGSVPFLGQQEGSANVAQAESVMRVQQDLGFGIQF
jgi:hypothetical protein